MSDLVELRQKLDEAARIRDLAGMQNVSDKTPEERVAIDLAYQRTCDAWFAAYLEYNGALRMQTMGGLSTAAPSS